MADQSTHSSARSTSADDRLTHLAHDPVGRLLWRYSLPAVVGILVMQLYNVVDRIFIGKVVGDDAIAGLAITFPVANIATALGVLIGAGASARLSIALGNNNFERARHITGNALTLTLGIGIIYLTLLGVFIDPLLELFGANEATLPYARDMMLYILPGLLLTNLAFSFNNVMRASGFPTRAMVTMFIGAAVNIVLDPIFIYVFDWGIKGAAIATDIAMAASAIFVMAHFIKPHGPVYFACHTFRLRRSIVLAICSIGAAPSIVNLASCLINILINRSLAAHGGSGAIASAGVFVTFTAFIVASIIGICQGMQPIVGYNFGAGNLHRLRSTYLLTVAVATGICAIGYVCSLICPRAISSLFLSNDALISSTARALRISMSVFWMVGFQVVSTTFFQSIGQAGKSIFLSLTRQVIFLLPLLLWLPSEMGIDGIWWSFPLSDLFATIVTALLIITALRKLGKIAK